MYEYDSAFGSSSGSPGEGGLRISAAISAWCPAVPGANGRTNADQQNQAVAVALRVLGRGFTTKFLEFSFSGRCATICST